jgi:hypothetical protein
MSFLFFHVSQKVGSNLYFSQKDATVEPVVLRQLFLNMSEKSLLIVINKSIQGAACTLFTVNSTKSAWKNGWYFTIGPKVAKAHEVTITDDDDTTSPVV